MPPTADHILKNCQTTDGSTVDIALAGSKIVAVGYDLGSSYPKEEHTQVHDLARCLITSGLWDSHMHLYHWCQMQGSIDLSSCTKAEEVLEALKDVPKNSDWVQGFGLKPLISLSPKALNRHHLDAVLGDRPLLLWSHDHHFVLANTQALALANLPTSSKTMDGGLIGRDHDGKLNGWLGELAANKMRELIPPPAPQKLQELLLTAQNRLHQLGITGICDQRIKDQDEVFPLISALKSLERANLWKVRTTINFASHHLDSPSALEAYKELQGNFLRPGHVKVFADGTMGSRTARMFSPFNDKGQGADGRGVYLTSPQDMDKAFKKAVQVCLPISVHAIGDEANRLCLDLFFQLKKQKFAEPLLAHRIEHAQLLDDQDINRFAELGVIASVQAGHLIDDRDTADDLLGSRACIAYRFLDLYKSGATIIFGSDAPISDIDPRYGIQAAVHRRLLDENKPAWYPEQCLPSEVVWQGYTQKAASALGWRDLTGELKVDKEADIVIWSADPTKDQAKVLKTFVGGKLVYEKGG